MCRGEYLNVQSQTKHSDRLGTAKSSRTDDPHTDIVTLESRTGSALRKIKAARRRDALCTGSKRISEYITPQRFWFHTNKTTQQNVHLVTVAMR